jgi:hypothetical protein
MLFGIGATATLTFAAATLGMILVALLATLIPALRATRVFTGSRDAVRIACGG